MGKAVVDISKQKLGETRLTFEQHGCQSDLGHKIAEVSYDQETRNSRRLTEENWEQTREVIVSKQIDWYCYNGTFVCGADRDTKYGTTMPCLPLRGAEGSEQS